MRPEGLISTHIFQVSTDYPFRFAARAVCTNSRNTSVESLRLRVYKIEGKILLTHCKNLRGSSKALRGKEVDLHGGN